MRHFHRSCQQWDLRPMFDKIKSGLSICIFCKRWRKNHFNFSFESKYQLKDKLLPSRICWMYQHKFLTIFSILVHFKRRHSKATDLFLGATFQNCALTFVLSCRINSVCSSGGISRLDTANFLMVGTFRLQWTWPVDTSLPLYLGCHLFICFGKSRTCRHSSNLSCFERWKWTGPIKKWRSPSTLHVHILTCQVNAMKKSIPFWK